MKFTQNKAKFLILPILIIVVGIVMYAVRGFNFDTEFVGGIRMQVNVGSSFENEELKNLVVETCGEVAAPVVQKIGDGTQATIKMSELDLETKTALDNAIKAKYGEEAIMSSNSASANGNGGRVVDYFENCLQRDDYIFVVCGWVGPDTPSRMILDCDYGKKVDLPDRTYVKRCKTYWIRETSQPSMRNPKL